MWHVQNSFWRVTISNFHSVAKIEKQNINVTTNQEDVHNVQRCYETPNYRCALWISGFSHGQLCQRNQQQGLKDSTIVNDSPKQRNSKLVSE